jgi:predicted Rossmann fold nucleotide-binding protein DprA/Smf involved in DNA uptake
MLLCCAVEGGDPAVAELVQNLGAEGAWAKIMEGVLGEPVAQRAAQVRVEVFERLAEAARARFVVPGEDEWPGGLDDLRHTEPIQRRGGEPFGLWVRGPGHLAHLMERSVAMVGSRAATARSNPSSSSRHRWRHRTCRRRQCSNLPGALTALESAGLVEGDQRGWLVAVGGPRCYP